MKSRKKLVFKPYSKLWPGPDPELASLLLRAKLSQMDKTQADDESEVKNMAREKEVTTVSSIIESVANEICDGYCRFAYEFNQLSSGSDEMFEKLQAEHCSDCPLNKLI